MISSENQPVEMCQTPLTLSWWAPGHSSGGISWSGCRHYTQDLVWKKGKTWEKCQRTKCHWIIFLLSQISLQTLKSNPCLALLSYLVHELQVIAGLQYHLYLFTFLPSMCASFLPSNSSRTAGTWNTDVKMWTFRAHLHLTLINVIIYLINVLAD